MQHERHCEHSDDCAPDFKGNERRTWAVVALTFVVMIGELVAGYWSGSMALTADGWHMGTHVGALALAGFAYWCSHSEYGLQFT